VLTEPDNAQLVGSQIEQQRGEDGSPASSHSAFEPHPIQGWTPDFIPLVMQELLDKNNYDKLVPIPGSEGVRWAQLLARQEGILTGISGGATFATAMQVAELAEPGSVILCMLPDTGERYLSTPLFADIESEMDEEERGIANSTPGYQMPS
jgi:cysteine synthase A